MVHYCQNLEKRDTCTLLPTCSGTRGLDWLSDNHRADRFKSTKAAGRNSSLR